MVVERGFSFSFFFFFSMTVISLGVAQSCIVDLGVKGWTFLHLDLELEVLEEGDRGGKVCNQIALLNYNNHHCHPKVGILSQVQ